MSLFLFFDMANRLVRLHFKIKESMVPIYTENQLLSCALRRPEPIHHSNKINKATEDTQNGDTGCFVSIAASACKLEMDTEHLQENSRSPFTDFKSLEAYPKDLRYEQKLSSI